jgi:hypothetical protein
LNAKAETGYQKIEELMNVGCSRASKEDGKSKRRGGKARTIGLLAVDGDTLGAPYVEIVEMGFRCGKEKGSTG